MFLCEAVIQQRLLYIFLSRGRCPATGLLATSLNDFTACMIIAIPELI
jgi:hypothetical protein